MILFLIGLLLVAGCQTCSNPCNGICYNPDTQDCCDGTYIYNRSSQSCCNGKVFNATSPLLVECGDTCYLPPVEGCCDGTIYDKYNEDCCNGTTYNKNGQSCIDETVYDGVGLVKCGDTDTYYNMSTQSCCGDTVYNTSSLFCCSGAIYDPNNQDCCNGEISNKGACGEYCGMKNCPAGQRCCNNAHDNSGWYIGPTCYDPRYQECVKVTPTFYQDPRGVPTF